VRYWLTRIFCCVLVALSLHGAAWADQSDEESRARTHYAAGKALYGLGNYSDALRELLVGYSLVPKPQFLLNIGQCYRRLDDPVKAREMYKKYLDEVPADDRERPQVDELIVELDRQIEERAQKARAEAPPPPPQIQAPVPAPSVLVAAPAPIEKARWKRRAWMWAVPVAVVAAAGLSVGLYFALRPAGCSASFACISAGGSGN
jgi:tetratricopeptide (TPR) repeat protein